MKERELNSFKQRCKDFNVLYVEDDEKVRIQTAKVLSIFFENITLATNGKDGLVKLENNKIDIIFTDISMPVMDGISMIKHIRITNRSIPIVVLSAYDYTDYFLKTIEYGIDGYILKPFKLFDIKKIIEKVINKIQESGEIIHTIKLIKNYEWHIETSTLSKESQEIKLTKNERKLFKLLSTAKHGIFSSEDIETELFDDSYSDNKRVRGLISRVNKKVGIHLIKSVYGEGYELELDKTC